MSSNDNIFSLIKRDVKKKGVLYFLQSYLFSAQYRVLLNYRLGRWFTKRGGPFKLLAKVYRYRLITKRACDISYHANLADGIKFPHPLGIVIGREVIIKDNVTIYQQVTLGSHGSEGKELKYPIIEKNVKIFAGAKVIGGVIIGENSIIGASTFVNVDIPPNSIAFGIPCRIKSKK